MKVVDYWEENHGWDWVQLDHVLPATKLRRLADAVINSSINKEDRRGWLDSKGGLFSVKSSYRLVASWEGDVGWEGWTLICKARVQQRVRVFLLSMAHGRLSTNKERWRRRMTSNPDYARCWTDKEDVVSCYEDSL